MQTDLKTWQEDRWIHDSCFESGGEVSALPEHAWKSEHRVDCGHVTVCVVTIESLLNKVNNTAQSSFLISSSKSGKFLFSIVLRSCTTLAHPSSHSYLRILHNSQYAALWCNIFLPWLYSSCYVGPLLHMLGEGKLEHVQISNRMPSNVLIIILSVHMGGIVGSWSGFLLCFWSFPTE